MDEALSEGPHDLTAVVVKVYPISGDVDEPYIFQA